MKTLPIPEYLHPEAFKLMRYRCTNCGYIELIWNSRDGVTPFIMDCPKCGDESQHDDWNNDKFLPGHELDMKVGDRYFIDCTKEKFIEYKKKTIDEYWEGNENSPPMKDYYESKETALAALMQIEFETGQPDVAVWTQSDYDTYHPKSNLINGEVT